jgi:hypothetical protein
MALEIVRTAIAEETGEAKPYVVGWWGSHPDEENDDCCCAQDYATLEEAKREYFAKVEERFVMYVEIDGPNIHKIRRNPRFRRDRDDDEWQRERAMQAGMAFGVDAYNDEMGW